MAERLLSQFGGLPGLVQASHDELCGAHGIGEAKATQIKAALELGRRLLATAPYERPQVRSPGDAASLLMLEMGLLEQEQLRTLLLDTKNTLLRIVHVYTGSLNTAVVRVGEVFREAIRANCASIIVVHNHPSRGPDPQPGGCAGHRTAGGRRPPARHRSAGPSGDRPQSVCQSERARPGLSVSGQEAGLHGPPPTCQAEPCQHRWASIAQQAKSRVFLKKLGFFSPHNQRSTGSHLS